MPAERAQYHPGDVIRYRSERDNRWCREGMAIGELRNGTVVFFDTYWQHGDQHRVTDTELVTAKVVFNLNDYDEMPSTQRYVWEKYAEYDRRAVSSQHGLQWRYFTRKGATESLAQQIDNARERLAEAESKAESAASAVRWAKQELAELEAKREAVPSV